MHFLIRRAEEYHKIKGRDASMKKIGIIGGGLHSKMLILEGKRLDYQFVILDPDISCPAHGSCDLHIVAEYDDTEAIRRLASKTDVVTYELDSIRAKILEEIEIMGVPVYPSSRTLSLIQDKYSQKQWMRQNGIPVPDFIKVDSLETVYQAGEDMGYPFMLKSCKGSFDGNGNYLIREKREADKAYRALGSGRRTLMLERVVELEKEISVLACRNSRGQMEVFPAAENRYENNLLIQTIVPARIGNSIAQEASRAAERCLEAFDVCGLLCVELFVTKDGEVLVNELALHPHSSGHYTIEGCVTSQYEQHMRSILGLPLGSGRLLRPTAMKNILGMHNGAAHLHGLAEAYSGNPDVKIYIYGKEQVRNGSLMGHVTAVADTLEEALRQVESAHSAVYFSDEEN